jgi:hypothetical protein
VNRTTDREGAYILDIPSVVGFNCESDIDGVVIHRLYLSVIGTSSSYVTEKITSLKKTLYYLVQLKDMIELSVLDQNVCRLNKLHGMEWNKKNRNVKASKTDKNW